MGVISANISFNRGGHDLLDNSTIQNNYSAAMKWAADVNSNAAIGQYIYINNSETKTEGSKNITYSSGPYIVVGIGKNAKILPIPKSMAGTDLSDIVSNNLNTGLTENEIDNIISGK